MKLNTRQVHYLHELKDLHSAERQVLRALPWMTMVAASPRLKAAFEARLTETREHVTRLEQVMALSGAGTRRPGCKGQGLLEEGKDMIAEEAEEEVRDAGRIAAAQRVEHCGMEGSGRVGGYEDLMGLNDAGETLRSTRDEAGVADQKPTEPAGSAINLKANQ